METPLDEGECDKIGGKALDNGRRNEQVVKAKWRCARDAVAALPVKRKEKEKQREGGRKVTRLEGNAVKKRS